MVVGLFVFFFFLGNPMDVEPKLPKSKVRHHLIDDGSRTANKAFVATSLTSTNCHSNEYNESSVYIYMPDSYLQGKFIGKFRDLFGWRYIEG